MTPIYVIGSSNTDMVVKAGKLPLPGETILGGTFFMNPGGKGANQAVAAARLGGSVTFIANLGNDVFGHQAVKHFNNENINTQFVSHDTTSPSGVALIIVDSKGENSIVVAPGSNGNLLPDAVERALQLAKPLGIVLLQMEIPDDTIERAVAVSNSMNLKVILNPAPARRLSPQLLSRLFLITPNETEAELLTGIAVSDISSASKAATKLKKAGVRNIIITLGSQGAYLLSDEVSVQIPSPKVKAIDTTAAGDCFNGALVTALAGGQSLEDAVVFATKAASISVTRLGAQASMPFRSEVDAMLTTSRN